MHIMASCMQEEQKEKLIEIKISRPIREIILLEEDMYLSIIIKILQNQLWMNNLKNEQLLLLKTYCVVVKITLINFFCQQKALNFKTQPIGN